MKEIKNTLEIYFGEDKREEHQTDSAVGMFILNLQDTPETY